VLGGSVSEKFLCVCDVGKSVLVVERLLRWIPEEKKRKQSCEGGLQMCRTCLMRRAWEKCRLLLLACSRLNGIKVCVL
jgi:hypothetical protein